MKYFFGFCALILTNFLFCSCATFDEVGGEIVLFESGKDGYNTFRIPAICEGENGAIFAFAEGRKESAKDWGNIDIVMRRSFDGGKTWDALQVVAQDSNTCGNPQPVYCKNTAELILIYSWNLAKDSERNIILKRSLDTRRVFVIKSKDYGKTWTSPKELTDIAKPKEATWFASGPGGAIVIESGAYKGRIIAPFNTVFSPDNSFRVACLYSDDNAETWKRGEFINAYDVNESQIAQLDNDTLLIGMRSQKFGQKHQEDIVRENPFRKVAMSKDGGATWGEAFYDNELIDPVCEGALEAFFDGSAQRIICSSNASHPSKRENLTLKFARAKDYEMWLKNLCPQNDSKRWFYEIIINKNRSAYSDMALLKDNSLALLYETGNNTVRYEKIIFLKVKPKLKSH